MCLDIQPVKTDPFCETEATGELTDDCCWLLNKEELDFSVASRGSPLMRGHENSFVVLKEGGRKKTEKRKETTCGVGKPSGPVLTWELTRPYHYWLLRHVPDTSHVTTVMKTHSLVDLTQTLLTLLRISHSVKEKAALIIHGRHAGLHPFSSTCPAYLCTVWLPGIL